MKKDFNFLDEELTAQECFKQMFESVNSQLYSEFNFTNVRENPDVEPPMDYGKFPDEFNTLITATLKNDSKFIGTTDQVSYEIKYDRCVPLDMPWWVRREMVEDPSTELDYHVWIEPGSTIGELLDVLALVPYNLKKTDVFLSQYNFDTSETMVLADTDPVPYDELSYIAQIDIEAKPDSLIYRDKLPVTFRVRGGNLNFRTVVLDKTTTQTAGPELSTWLAEANGEAYLFDDQAPMMDGSFDYSDPDADGVWKTNTFTKVSDWGPVILSGISTHQMATFYARGIWPGYKYGTGGWSVYFDSSGWAGYTHNSAIPYSVDMVNNPYLKGIFYGNQYGPSYNAVDVVVQLALSKAKNASINIIEKLIPDSRYPSAFDMQWKYVLGDDIVLDGVSYKEVLLSHPLERAQISVLVQNGTTVKDHITNLIKNTGGITVWGSYGVKNKIYCNPFSTMDNLSWYYDINDKLKVKLDQYKMFSFIKGENISNEDMFHYETAVMLCLPANSFTTSVSLTGNKLEEIRAFDNYYSATDHPFFVEKEYPEADIHCTLTITMHDDSVFFKEGDTFTVSVTPVFNM